MTCEDALILISGRLDGENTPAEEAMLEEHLARCINCRRILEAYAAADQGLLALTETPPEKLHQRIMDAVAAEPRSAGHRHRFRPAALGLAAAAALALVLGLNYFPQQQSTIADQSAAVRTINMPVDTLPSEDSTSQAVTREVPDSVAPATFNIESDAVDADTASSLLVELVDNPASPAAQTIPELREETAEIDSTCGIYRYDLTAAVVRQIIADYSALYAFRTHGDLENAADSAACQLIIVCG